MKTPREFACAQTSRSSQLACAGNDGGPHGNVCDLVTLAIEARDAEHRAELDAAQRTIEQLGKDGAAIAAKLDRAVELVKEVATATCPMRFSEGITLSDRYRPAQYSDCGKCLVCRAQKFLAAPEAKSEPGTHAFVDCPNCGDGCSLAGRCHRSRGNFSTSYGACGEARESAVHAKGAKP